MRTKGLEQDEPDRDLFHEKKAGICSLIFSNEGFSGT